MHQVENPSDQYLRPRSRRSKVDLHCCQDCKLELTTDNWSPSMRGETGHRKRYICRSCWSARQRKYSAKKDPQQLREMKNAARVKRQAEWSADRKEQDRRRRYGKWLERTCGMTIDEYDAIYEEQGGKCKICSTPHPRGRGGFHVDHCHTSGSIRGLLCTGCNMMLGLAKDSTETLKRAIQYLADNDNHKLENRRAEGGKAF